MAKNPDFQKIVFKDVEFAWPRLDQPYRYDQHKKESVPCAPGANMAAFSIAWEVSKEKADEFRSAMEAHYNECRARNSSLPEFSGVFGMSEKEGVIRLNAKKSAMNNNGEENTPPSVIDLYHEELAEKKIWSGSRGSIRILAHPSINPQNNLGGISLILNAVQVSEAKYGGDGFEDDFGKPLERQSGASGDPGPSPDPSRPYDEEVPF